MRRCIFAGRELYTLLTQPKNMAHDSSEVAGVYEESVTLLQVSAIFFKWGVSRYNW